MQVGMPTRPPEELGVCGRLSACDSIFPLSEASSSRRQVLLGSSNGVQKVACSVLAAERLAGLGGSRTRELEIRTDCLEIGFELAQPSLLLLQTGLEASSAEQRSLQVTLQLPDPQVLPDARRIELLIE